MTDGCLRHTVRSEQWVIDHLVEAVEAGDASEKQRLGAIYVRRIGELDWSKWRLVEEGAFLANEALSWSRPTTHDATEVFEDEALPAGRFQALKSGDRPTAAERVKWRERLSERAFSEELVYEAGAWDRLGSPRAAPLSRKAWRMLLGGRGLGKGGEGVRRGFRESQ